jgi:S-adenosylmethionine uptake transporter
MAKGVLLAFLSYALYSFSDACIKLLEGTLDPYQIVFYGSLIGVAVIPFVKQSSDRWTDLFVARRPAMWLFRAAMAAIGATSAVIAFTALPMAEAFALIFLLPVFVTLLSVLFLHEEVGWKRWSAVLIGLLGVLIVLRPGFRELSIGHVAAIACGFSSAVAIILLRILGRTEKPVTLYGSGLLGPMAVCGLLMIPGYSHPDLHQWGFLIAYGLFGSAATALITVAARLAPASLIAPPQYSQMAWGIVFGYFLFGDHIDWPTVIGIVVIMAAGLFTFVRERNGKAVPLSSSAEPVQAASD